jgi:hypothetical protein
MWNWIYVPVVIEQQPIEVVTTPEQVGYVDDDTD